MKYYLDAIESPEDLNLDAFCSMYDFSIVVSEQIPDPRFVASFAGIDYLLAGAYGYSGEPGGKMDFLHGGGASAEEAIVDLTRKLGGRMVLSKVRDVRVRVPKRLTIGALEPMRHPTESSVAEKELILRAVREHPAVVFARDVVERSWVTESGEVRVGKVDFELLQRHIRTLFPE